MKQNWKHHADSPTPGAGSPVGDPCEFLPAAPTALPLPCQHHRPGWHWPGLQVPHLPRGRSPPCPGLGLPWGSSNRTEGPSHPLGPASPAGFTTAQVVCHLHSLNVKLRFGMRSAGMEQINSNKILYHGRQHQLVERTIHLHYLSYTH